MIYKGVPQHHSITTSLLHRAMFDPSKYTVQTAKPIPVLLLLDTSTSMYGPKIDTLNSAVRQMLAAFAKEARREVEVKVSIITFGSSINRLQPFTSASAIDFQPLSADGMTPLGAALRAAKDMIEDKTETPSRAYRPTVVLVSDGQPTDRWEEPLRAFISEGRSAKCDRMAMAIGADANKNILGRFIEGTPNPLFEAHQASEIQRFFKLVTMSVTTRMHSSNPHQVPDLRSEFPSSASPTSLPGGAPSPGSVVQPFSPESKEAPGSMIATRTGNPPASAPSGDDDYF